MALSTHLPAPKPIEAAPELGQHNEEIYGQLLGLTVEEMADLAEAGVL